MHQTETPTCNISKKSGIATVLKKAKIIIWDELPMAHRNYVEALNYTLQDFKEENNVMGNTLLLLAGDIYRQKHSPNNY